MEWTASPARARGFSSRASQHREVTPPLAKSARQRRCRPMYAMDADASDGHRRERGTAAQSMDADASDGRRRMRWTPTRAIDSETGDWPRHWRLA